MRMWPLVGRVSPAPFRAVTETRTVCRVGRLRRILVRSVNKRREIKARHLARDPDPDKSDGVRR